MGHNLQLLHFERHVQPQTHTKLQSCVGCTTVRRVLVQDVHRRWVATELDWKLGLAGRCGSGIGAGMRVVYEKTP